MMPIGKNITMEEVKSVLSNFLIDKNLRTNGWTTKLFLHFFDLLGKEITEVVDESRRGGRIHGSLDSTYITLISNNDHQETLSDYRSISLCNLLYKLTTKIIADRLNLYWVSLSWTINLDLCQIDNF